MINDCKFIDKYIQVINERGHVTVCDVIVIVPIRIEITLIDFTTQTR